MSDVEGLAEWFHREFQNCVHLANTRSQCKAWADQLGRTWLADRVQAARAEALEEAAHLTALLRAVVAYDDANQSDLPLALLTEIRLAIGAPA